MKFMWVALGKMVLAFAMGTYVVLGSACQVAWDSYLLHGMYCSFCFLDDFVLASF